jgi:LacI family transcriptional regulator
LAQIASAAGVSVSTVSKVVNGRPDVAADTRARVQQVLRELSYEPRRVDDSRPPSVAVLFHGPLMTYSLEILEGVLAAAREVEADVVVARIDGSPQAAHRILERAVTDWQAVIAVTSFASELSALSRAHVPTVVIDPIGAPQSEVVSVGSTNFSGGLAATQHLLELGHRRIAYVGGTPGAACNQARLQGFRGAMETARARIAKGYTRTGRFEYANGLVEGAALLDLPQPPTAIFAANDEMALGAMRALHELGRDIPGEVSVVGFDDMGTAGSFWPPLTTVRQDFAAVGRLSIGKLLRKVSDPAISNDTTIVPTELVIRRSTAAPAEPASC